MKHPTKTRIRDSAQTQKTHKLKKNSSALQSYVFSAYVIRPIIEFTILLLCTLESFDNWHTCSLLVFAFDALINSLICQTWTLCKATFGNNFTCRQICMSILTVNGSKCQRFALQSIHCFLVEIFLEIRRCFSKIAGNSADTAINALRTADAPLW